MSGFEWAQEGLRITSKAHFDPHKVCQSTACEKWTALRFFFPVTIGFVSGS